MLKTNRVNKTSHTDIKIIPKTVNHEPIHTTTAPANPNKSRNHLLAEYPNESYHAKNRFICHLQLFCCAQQRETNKN